MKASKRSMKYRKDSKSDNVQYRHKRPEPVEEGVTGIEREDTTGFCYDCGQKVPCTCPLGQKEE